MDDEYNWMPMCDCGPTWVDYAQLVGVVGTIAALIFTAYELRQSASERKRLTHRLRHERLEDLSIAIAHAMDSVMRLDAVNVMRDLSELRARVVALTREAHPKAWRFAEEKVTVEEPFGFDLRARLRGLAEEAQEETEEALRESARLLAGGGQLSP